MPARAALSSLLLALALIALAAYALTSASLYDLRFLALVCIYAIMVLGYQFVFGHVGAVSLAQSTFFGLGGYVTGLAGVAFGLDTAMLLPLSILAPVLLAALIAAPVLKLEDHYFSLATLGIALIVQLVAVNWDSLTGGLNGFSGIPGIVLFGFPVEGRLNVFLFCWAGLVVATVIALRILESLYGFSFNLVRESPHAAASLGIDVGRMRLVALLLSAAFGGLAGALMAHVLRVVSPENLDLSLMATCLIMTVVGGSTRPLGAIVGALLIVFLRERFRIAQSYSLIIYTGATLAILVLAPYGIVGSIERLWARRVRGDARPAADAAADSADGGGALEPPAREPSPDDRALLGVRGVAKRFGGVQALDGVDLAVRDGEIVGLIGPNGSGKTTLINVISGLYVADAGEIVFAGRPIADLPAHAIARLGMARTFQHIDLVDDLSVLDNIAIGTFCSERASLALGAAHARPRPAPDAGARARRRACAPARRGRRCGGALRRASLRHPAPRRGRARARRRSAPSAARRAGRRPQRARAGRSRRAHPAHCRGWRHRAGHRAQSHLPRRARDPPHLPRPRPHHRGGLARGGAPRSARDRSLSGAGRMSAPVAAKQPLLSVERLHVRYDAVTALRDVTVTVNPGEAVALVGANGAGKSTLFKSIMGFLKPAAGAIVFAGAPLGRLPPEARCRLGLGYCPEGRRVFPGLTVRENLEVAATGPARARRTRVDEAFALFPVLAERRDALGWQLSGGQQQMLAIAAPSWGARACSCSTSRRSGSRPSWSTRCCARCAPSWPAARRCCSPSRTSPRRSPAASAPTSWRSAPSRSPAPPPTCRAPGK